MSAHCASSQSGPPDRGNAERMPAEGFDEAHLSRQRAQPRFGRPLPLETAGARAPANGHRSRMKGDHRGPAKGRNVAGQRRSQRTHEQPDAALPDADATTPASGECCSDRPRGAPREFGLRRSCRPNPASTARNGTGKRRADRRRRPAGQWGQSQPEIPIGDQSKSNIETAHLAEQVGADDDVRGAGRHEVSVEKAGDAALQMMAAAHLRRARRTHRSRHIPRRPSRGRLRRPRPVAA